jgi:NADH-ubiquinone oxidoreductase chain 2
MPKLSILIFLIEIFTHLAQFPISLISLGAVGYGLNNYLGFIGGLAIKNLLLLSSLFSFILGTVVGLAQTKIKRLLAYSI